MHPMKLSSVLALFVLLTGCSSFSPKDSYTVDPRSSQALNIVNAVGMNQKSNLKDVPQEQLAKSASSANYVTEASLIGAGSLASVGQFAGAGLALVPALLPTATENYEFDRWIIWMPKGDLTREQARDNLVEMFTGVVAQNYPETAIEINNRHKASVDSVSMHIDLPVEATAPSWLGEYPAYAWGVGPRAMLFGNGIFWMDIPTCNTVGKFYKEDHNEIRECLLDLTKDMPEWVYMYNAPKLRGAWVAKTDEDGSEIGSEWRSSIEGADYPVIFNQGKAHVMIEPTNSES